MFCIVVVGMAGFLWQVSTRPASGIPIILIAHLRLRFKMTCSTVMTLTLNYSEVKWSLMIPVAV